MTGRGDLLDLRSCASTLRSRNAGSFHITLDVLFRSPELYDAWRASGLLTAEAVAPLFGLSAPDVAVIWYPPAKALKLTFPRRQTAGGPLDTDTDGAQLFVLLLDLAIPASSVSPGEN